MNDKRRDKIKELKTKFNNTKKDLDKLVIELSSMLNEEQDAFDNMPEGLQSSYRGMCSEDAINNMEEASDKLDEVIDLLNEIM